MIGLPARIALFVVVCVPLLTVFFRVEMEGQMNTWPSIFSIDTTPVYTHQSLIHIDQKLRLAFGVSSVYLCQFVADVAFRRCSIRYRTVLESRCSLKHRIWSDAQRVGMPAFTGTLHQPERLLQASEWVASWTTYGLLLDVSKGCVRLLTDQITVVASLTPRQIDRGDVKWPYTLRQKQGSTEAGSVGREEHDSSFS